MTSAVLRASNIRLIDRRWVLRVLLVFGLLSGFVAAALPVQAATVPRAAAPIPITSGVPRFEAAPCVYTLGDSQEEGKTVTCGFVVVAEKHANPDGKTIRLPVAVYKAVGPEPAPEMTILMTGGPGQSGQVYASIIDQIAPFYEGLAANNDVVVFDQRGTGKSEPALLCPEALGSDPLNPPPFVASRLQCRDRLIAQGIDLAAYTTSENAADVNDIRLALGYPAMNLVGASYGTELGLAVARDHGQYVRSSSLVSIVPLQQFAFADFVPNFDRAMRALFAACAADASCNATYPNLQAAYQTTIAQLDRAPANLTIPLLTGGERQYTMTSKAYIEQLFGLFYDTSLIPFLPDMLTRGARGDFRWLAYFLQFSLLPSDDPDAIGMQTSMICSRNPTAEQLTAALAAGQSALPEIRAAMEHYARDFFAVCADWPSRGADPKANSPATSDRPTVLISGQFDPVTPPAYAATAKQTLPNAVAATLAGGGHSAHNPGLPAGDCGFALTVSNIANPGKPDLSCVGQLRAIFLPLPPIYSGDTPGASPTPAPSSSPAPIPSPPPTGNGGNYPGLPNTGAGGSAMDNRTPWVLLLAMLAIGTGGGLVSVRFRRRSA